jgi:hypothetical protein
MAYATHADVASFLGVTLTSDEQTLVTGLIGALQAHIDKATNRSFEVSGNQTEVFDGNSDTFFVKAPPIASIISVSIDSVVYALSNTFAYGSYIRLATKAPSGNQNVVIVYSSAITVPADVKHAVVRWAGETFQTRDESGKTISRLSLGQYSVEYLAKAGVPDFVEVVLKRYRLGGI